MGNGGIYWESIDRMNTYPIRLKRFEDFCRLVQELKITTTYPNTIFITRNLTLGNYYFQIGDKNRAQRYFKAWIGEHPEDISVQKALDQMQIEI